MSTSGCVYVCIPVVKSCPRSIYLSKYKSKVQWSIHEVYTNDNIIICTLAYMYNEMIPSNMKREERFNKQRFVHESSMAPEPRLERLIEAIAAEINVAERLMGKISPALAKR